MRNRTLVFLASVSLSLVVLTASLEGSDRRLIEALAEKYRTWLEEVDLLIGKQERKKFLRIEKDYQRDAFIESFWAARDPYPETERNEFRDAWYARLEFAEDEFEHLSSDRSRILLLNGEPEIREAFDICPMLLQPLEVWWYRRTARTESALRDFYAIFYQPLGVGWPRLWRPSDGLTALFVEPPEILLSRCPEEIRFMTAPQGMVPQDIPLQCALSAIYRGCGTPPQTVLLRQALANIKYVDRLTSYDVLVGKLEMRPDARDGEWLDSFAAYSTDLPSSSETFTAEARFAYPGGRGARTVVQGTITVPVAGAAVLDLDGRRSYNFLLTGEILRDEELFESFRYRFDVPIGQVVGEAIPLTFERLLRPGEFSVIVKLEDLNSGRLYREVRALVVPKADDVHRPPEGEMDPETARLAAGAEAAITGLESTIRIVPPDGERLVGAVRFETAVTGPGFSRVSFFLDGRLMLTKKRPPFSIELDLGRIPRPHTLRVSGYDDADNVIAGDELELNVGTHRFAVKLIEPRRHRRYEASTVAEAEVTLPESQRLERLELFLGETLVATLYQPPYRQPIMLPPGLDLTYVRAVGYLDDGGTAEDMVFINAPDLLEEVDIQFVELYTAVTDRDGRPVSGLAATDFRVLEDGVEQEIARFEVVRDLPIHAGILLDTSASMVDRLSQARDAALRFFRQIMTPKDRATFVTFNQRPFLAAPFTADIDAVATELAGLKAEGGTALYDSVIFTLYYFTGIRGQRALLVLSDGEDQSSRFSFEEALAYAQTVGVKIYTIGLDPGKTERLPRTQLAKLAEATGGRAFFVKDVAELDAIYSAIEEELRSQYLIAYQSTNTSGEGEFRTVDLALVGRDAEVRTLRGYYP